MIVTSSLRTLALLCACSSSALALAQTPEPQLEAMSTVSRASARAKKHEAVGKRAILREINAKEAAIKDVAARAEIVNTGMQKLASSGAAANEETANLMKSMLKELQDMNARLQRLEDEVAELKGWKEGQAESLPVIKTDVDALKRFKPSFYAQFQYRDSDQRGADQSFAGQHGFQLRRFRVGGTYTIDNRTKAKISFDGATGADGRGFQLRDAVLSWTLEPLKDRTPTALHAGVQILPMGFDLPRSSGDREFPERAIGTQRLFNGERFRSAYLTKAIDEHFWVWAGLGGSLTVNDPEQSTLAFSRAGRTAGFGGIRYDSKQISAGVSYFEGERPSVTGKASSAAVQRRFLFLDLTYVGFLVPELALRGEVWIGRDRVPSATAGPAATGQDMSQWQAQLVYNLSRRNQVFGRYVLFDPNESAPNNSVREYGLGWRYFINPGVTVTFTYEWVRDLGISNANRDYEVATLRYQFRF